MRWLNVVRGGLLAAGVGFMAVGMGEGGPFWVVAVGAVMLGVYQGLEE